MQFKVISHPFKLKNSINIHDRVKHNFGISIRCRKNQMVFIYPELYDSFNVQRQEHKGGKTTVKGDEFLFTFESVLMIVFWQHQWQWINESYYEPWQSHTYWQSALTWSGCMLLQQVFVLSVGEHVHCSLLFIVSAASGIFNEVLTDLLQVAKMKS